MTDLPLCSRFPVATGAMLCTVERKEASFLSFTFTQSKSPSFIARESPRFFRLYQLVLSFSDHAIAVPVGA